MMINILDVMNILDMVNALDIKTRLQSHGSTNVFMPSQFAMVQSTVCDVHALMSICIAFQIQISETQACIPEASRKKFCEFI